MVGHEHVVEDVPPAIRSSLFYCCILFRMRLMNRFVSNEKEGTTVANKNGNVQAIWYYTWQGSCFCVGELLYNTEEISLELLE